MRKTPIRTHGTCGATCLRNELRLILRYPAASLMLSRSFFGSGLICNSDDTQRYEYSQEKI